MAVVIVVVVYVSTDFFSELFFISGSRERSIIVCSFFALCNH